MSDAWLRTLAAAKVERSVHGDGTALSRCWSAIRTVLDLPATATPEECYRAAVADPRRSEELDGAYQAEYDRQRGRAGPDSAGAGRTAGGA